MGEGEKRRGGEGRDDEARGIRCSGLQIKL